MEVKMYNENVPRAEHMLKGSFFGPWAATEHMLNDQIVKISIFWGKIAKICKFRGKNWKKLGKKYQNLHF